MTPEEIMELHNKKKKAEFKLLNGLSKDIKKNSKTLYNDIDNALREMEEKTAEWNAGELAKYDRMNKLNKKIEKSVRETKGREWELMLSFLVANANLVKQNTAEVLSELKGAPVAVKPLFKVQMKEITGNPWSGLSMKLRHQKATDELVLKAREAVTVSIMHEDKKEAKKAIEKVLETSVNRAEQLVATEKTHIDNEISKEAIKESGFETMLMYNATFDNTCSECESMHGNEYPVDDAPDLPRHVNCRCFYTPVIV